MDIRWRLVTLYRKTRATTFVRLQRWSHVKLHTQSKFSVNLKINFHSVSSWKIFLRGAWLSWWFNIHRTRKTVTSSHFWYVREFSKIEIANEHEKRASNNVKLQKTNEMSYGKWWSWNSLLWNAWDDRDDHLRKQQFSSFMRWTQLTAHQSRMS